MSTNHTLKQHYLIIFSIYKTIFSSKEFTPAQVAQTFNDDVKQWKKGQKTDLATALHGFYSKQFKSGSSSLKEDAEIPFISRKKNSKGEWVYSIDLSLESTLNACLNYVSKFLMELELYIFLDENDNEIERGINGQDNLFMSHPKIYHLWEWYENQTGELFEYALVD